MKELHEKSFYVLSWLLIGGGLVEFTTAMTTYQPNAILGAAAVVVAVLVLRITNCRLVYCPPTKEG